MDGRTDARTQEIAIAMGWLSSERERLTRLARRATDKSQPDAARRNLVRLAIVDLRFDSLVRERRALLGRN
jgi:hypothetical protein